MSIHCLTFTGYTQCRLDKVRIKRSSHLDFNCLVFCKALKNGEISILQGIAVKSCLK